MNKLKIQFGRGAGDSANATIPMEVINQNMHQVWSHPQRLGDLTEVDVEPGVYLVRAHLPSGEIVSAQARVDVNETEPVTVSLIPQDPAPRESLAWAYYLKGASRYEQVPHRGERLRDLSLPVVDLWHHVHQRWEQVSFLTSTSVDYSVHADDPRIVAAVSIDMDRWYMDLGSADLGQYWLQVAGDGYPSKFVALPFSRTLRILIVLDEFPDQENDPLNVIVDGGNPQAEALLSYLSTGALASARIVGESFIDGAEDLLSAKMWDPSSAAIGGYYLLQAAQLDRLHDWTNRLSEEMVWMPDGAVIHAWHMLKQQRPDVELARSRLLEAANRGTPFYTQGLRLLLDGLSLLNQRAKGADNAITLGLEQIGPYAAAADWQTPTTTFYGSNPSEPTPIQSLNP